MRRVGSLLFAVSCALLACTEKLPRRIEKAESIAPPEPPIGLDTRPVSTTCSAVPKPASSNALIGFQRVTTAKLERPVEIVQHAGRLYVLEQGGRVLRLEDDGKTASLVIDLTAKVVSGGEAGLLGMAFHPQFATNGFVYFYYTAPHPTQPPPDGVVFQSALVRLTSNDGGLTLDPASEKRILTVDQPYSNHNGGTIAFGNDGFLYWGLGDGGSGGDPQGHAQNERSLLGKMLRIDVDGGDPYAIPPSNPFANGAEGAPEIYALGLRNPYRFRFDPVTGVLWAGDVGQGEREEIDRITLGGNYGWNLREGKICYGKPACDNPFLDPVVDHPRTEASSITGGVVYRGAAVPLLAGKYVYGDFAQGTFFAIPIDDPAPVPTRLDIGLERTNPSAFAIDADGEIVFLEYGGEVIRIVAGAPPDSDADADANADADAEMPAKLSETGCVVPGEPTKPADGLFPYDVNVPQWVDGATAERHLAIPADSVIRSDPEGRLALPPGSVAMRTLSAEGRRVETQLLLHRPDATWAAYSYVWSDDQKDATLATGATEVTLPSGRKHVVVDRAQCLTCHSSTPSATIGLEASQLDRDDVDYGDGRLGNPLVTLEKLGMLEAPIARDVYAPLPRDFGFQTAELRARAYLHANCAFCHRGGDGQMDLRYRPAMKDMHVCGVPAPGATTARLVPREPQGSDLLRRMELTGPGRMPPLASIVPDPAGIEKVASWIASLDRCP